MTHDSSDANLFFEKQVKNAQSNNIEVNDSNIADLTDEEIDRQITSAIARAKKLTGILEQYKPSSNYYRMISDELDGKKVTANGLKYPYEITEEDLFFPSLEAQSDLQPLGDIFATE